MHQSDPATRQLTRRTVLRQGAAWLRLAVLAAFGYPLLRFLEFRVPRKPREVKVPKLLKEGGFYLDPDFVLFQGPEAAWAVSRTCTHLGCRVNYQQAENVLVCPCHQSRYAVSGERLSGPAERNLAVYPVARMAESEGQGYVVRI